MKSLSTPLLVLLLTLTSAAAFSQNSSKTHLFSSLPEVISFNEDKLNHAFNSKEGETVTLSFSDKFSFSGTVISNIKKYDNLYSMTIKSPELADAIFHLSKQINTDKTITFVGRIMSTKAYDGYEIKNDAAGKYSLKKIEEEKIRQLCIFN
jgi:hypothetical protein